MSLNWNFTNKTGFSAMNEQDQARNDLYIWGCLFVEMREITEKNYMEWYYRHTFHSKLFGNFYLDDYKVTPDEVKKRIGLVTNCSDKTRNQFVKKCMDRHFRP